MAFILKLPGLFRTASSVLLIGAEFANELAPLAGVPLERAALLTAGIGVIRALIRKIS